MDICRREHLHQVDLLAPTKQNITEKEYWFKRRGQKKLDEQNRLMSAEGSLPRNTKFQTEKEYLRNSIDAAASSVYDLEEFQQELLDKYQIQLKISRGRFSYLHPERAKAITGRNLGSLYEKDYLLERFEENKKIATPGNQWADAKGTLKNPIAPSGHYPADEKWNAILYVKSDLRLVVDLQNCIKARENMAYAQKVKLSNLKEMAKTVAYIQEHGYDTREELDKTFSDSKKHTNISRSELKTVEARLRSVNEQIHYTGQYLANKYVYTQFCKARNKGKFRKEHSTEITLYETARKFLKEHSTDGKLPSLKRLKSEKAKLLEKKNEALETYHYCRDCQKELHAVCSNVDALLGQMPLRQHKQEKNKDIP